ncbi:MAG: PorT family protein [Bacteroidales bacterium]|nr:PorT family protein [Bacteroidales bacterium]
MKLSLVIALLGMVSLVSAQSAALHVKGGLNMSNFYGSNLSGKDVKPGYHAGIALDLEFADDISLQTGLYFTSKGAEYTTNIPSGVGDIEYSLTANYIQLPLHLAYKIDVTPSTRLFFHAGPYVAYGINGTRSIENFTDDLKQYFGDKEVDTFDKHYGYKRLDMGVGLGVGAEFGRVLIDLGWDMGLMKTARNIEKLPVYNPNMKNHSAYLSIGYRIF